jgi:hypothetical protein
MASIGSPFLATFHGIEAVDTPCKKSRVTLEVLGLNLIVAKR